MRPPEPDSDETVRVLAGPRRRSRVSLAAAALLVAAVAGSAAVWLLWPDVGLAPVATSALVAPAAAPEFQVRTATEDEISQHIPTALTVFRFADNPHILVLDFASLHEQGKTLNRMAAFVEKAHLTHDRPLTDRELDAAVSAQGGTADTYYFGHDYAAASLSRFFALADSLRIELDPEEEKLRALLQQEGLLAPGALAALISVPAVGSDPQITQEARSVILRHELSHGEFFSNPEYAEYVRRFWMTELTGEERGAVRSFLGRQDYDVREEDLMYNEMQAYLMFTRAPIFFTPDMVGMSQQRLAELRARFLAGMPAGWLRDVLARLETPSSVP
jgi:hypothetical protein